MDINVDTTKLRESGNDILKYVSELRQLYSLMFNQISNISNNEQLWVGASEKYVEVVSKDKIKFISYLSNLTKYGTYLIKCADEYDKVIKEIKR